MNKILITTPTFSRYSDEPMQILQSAGLEVVRAKQPVKSEQDLIEQVDRDVIAIITGLEPISYGVIKAAANLKVIAKHGIGVDNIDLDAAKEQRVTVVNAPGTNTEAVADLAFGLMLAVARKITQANASIIAGEWPRVMGKSVWGATLGIIGLGSIGKSVTSRAKGFNMNILAYDPYFDKGYALANNVQEASLQEVLEKSDFITIHIPLLESTKGLIGANELKMMKNSAFLINTSRGGIVAEEDLYEALKTGVIAGAAFDVFSKEPPTGSPLLGLPNLIATPHMGGYTEEALKLMSKFAAEAVTKVLNGEKLSCVIV